MEKTRRFGDRKDGRLLRELDSMHYIVPLLYPNRCDNEAYISERIDLTNINAFLERKNAEGPEYKYNLFQIIVAAMVKTITLRPKMNRFIANRNIYQRGEVSASFVVKKEFADDGGEALAFLHSVPEDTIDTIKFEVQALDADCHRLFAVRLNFNLALADDLVLVLADLIALRQIGIEIVLPVEPAPRVDLCVEAKARAHGLLDAELIDHRQHAGHRRVHERDVCVWIAAISRARA